MLQKEKLRQYPLIVEDSGDVEHSVDDDLVRELIEKHLSELSLDCQKIIKLSFNNCTAEEIRQALNYNSIHHAIDRKYRCKNSLIKRITSDPLFKKIRNELR